MNTTDPGELDARMAAMSVTARHLRNERESLPDDLDDLLELRAAILAAGYSRRVADGVIGWLVGIVAGDHGRPDAVSGPTRARYRRVLADVAGRPPNEPGNGAPAVELAAAGPAPEPEQVWVSGLRRRRAAAARAAAARARRAR